MHKLLERQLKRHLGAHGFESIPESWRSFLEAVDQAYDHADTDRGLLERSVELASQELLERNAALVQEVRERRRTEEALRESERRFRMMSETAPVMIWMSGPDLRRNFFNKPWRDFIGYPSPRDTDIRWEDSVHPEDVRRCLEACHLALQAREPFSFEYRLRRVDGEYRWVLDTGVPLWASPGQLSGYIGSCLDIHERRQAEERKRELAAVTAAAKAQTERAEELEKAYQDLQRTQSMLIQSEKMGAVGQLASGVAHEVKNPLGIIIQGLDIVEDDLDQDQEGSAEAIRMMRDAVLRADRIIRGLLNFSRPDRLELKPMAVRQVIRRSLELVQPQLMTGGIRITEEMDADAPLVLLDENQMKQVFINLLLNACQAMQDGGTLSIRTVHMVLLEGDPGIGQWASGLFTAGAAVVVCEINDTGTGIRRDQLNKVFDPFYTTKPPGEGTGLGLSIVRSIVERHRGLIEIESEEGQGTRVRITLPATKGDTDGKNEDSPH